MSADTPAPAVRGAQLSLFSVTQCPRCGSDARNRFAYELRDDGAYNGCRAGYDEEDSWFAPHDPWHDARAHGEGR